MSQGRINKIQEHGRRTCVYLPTVVYASNSLSSSHLFCSFCPITSSIVCRGTNSARLHARGACCCLNDPREHRAALPTGVSCSGHLQNRRRRREAAKKSWVLVSRCRSVESERVRLSSACQRLAVSRQTSRSLGEKERECLSRPSVGRRLAALTPVAGSDC